MQNQRIHIAVAVIKDNSNRILLSQRHPDAHQGGLWEFPGGKVEFGENAEQALFREVHEELDLSVKSARPLITIPYNYSDKKVLLDVWMIGEYEGSPSGKEGQKIKWVALADLVHFRLPAANRTIVTACHLPDKYMITPEPEDADSNWQEYLNNLERSMATGITLLQFRAKTLEGSRYAKLAKEVISICHRNQCRVMLNVQDLDINLSGSDGIHLSSKLLLEQKDRKRFQSKLLGASCHNLYQLRHANKIGCDFAVLSPVMETLSHPDSNPLGWPLFKELCDESLIPIYALGGMEATYLPESWQYGAQGIAGISAFWRRD